MIRLSVVGSLFFLSVLAGCGGESPDNSSAKVKMGASASASADATASPTASATTAASTPAQ